MIFKLHLITVNKMEIVQTSMHSSRMRTDRLLTVTRMGGNITFSLLRTRVVNIGYLKEFRVCGFDHVSSRQFYGKQQKTTDLLFHS